MFASFGIALLKAVTGLWSVITAAFAWFQRRDDVRAGETQQAAADERETIAAQQRELGVSPATLDDVARRARDGTF